MDNSYLKMRFSCACVEESVYLSEHNIFEALSRKGNLWEGCESVC